MGGTRKLRLVTMAAAVAMTATVTVVPMAWGTTAAAPVAATDDDVVSTVAPVLKGNGATARTYSSQETQRVDAQGGDPAVLDYWTSERMAAATSLDEAGDRALVSEMAQNAARTMAAEASLAPADKTAPA